MSYIEQKYSIVNESFFGDEETAATFKKSDITKSRMMHL